jgi:hypothetical protein
MFRADRGGLASYNPYPGREPASITPTPARPDFQESPSSPEAVAAQDDGLLWYFQGVPLVLDVLPGMSRAGRGLEARETRLRIRCSEESCG